MLRAADSSSSKGASGTSAPWTVETSEVKLARSGLVQVPLCRTRHKGTVPNDTNDCITAVYLLIGSSAGIAIQVFRSFKFWQKYHVTGWKVGYVAAPVSSSAEFRNVHQFYVFTVNTPVPYGMASYMANPQPYRDFPAFYKRKRDLFRDGPCAHQI